MTGKLFKEAIRKHAQSDSSPRFGFSCTACSPPQFVPVTQNDSEKKCGGSSRMPPLVELNSDEVLCVVDGFFEEVQAADEEVDLKPHAAALQHTYYQQTTIAACISDQLRAHLHEVSLQQIFTLLD